MTLPGFFKSIRGNFAGCMALKKNSRDQIKAGHLLLIVSFPSPFLFQGKIAQQSDFFFLYTIFFSLILDDNILQIQQSCHFPMEQVENGRKQNVQN